MKKTIISLIILGIFVIGTNIAGAQSYRDQQQQLQQKISVAKVDLAAAWKQVDRLTKISPYRNDDLENLRKQELIKWAQQTTKLRNAIADYKMEVLKLDELIKFYE